MTIQDKSITGSWTPDGNEDEIARKTVPGGEVWYVDSVHASCSGDGGGGTQETGVAVSDSYFFNNVDPGSHDNASRDGHATVGDSSSNDGGTGTVGAYAYPGDDISVAERSDSGGGGTIVYMVGIRRIL